jgi:phosphatidylserine/phosphatidylglycerophosphate/cardiolipin synthase-like enzyme
MLARFLLLLFACIVIPAWADQLIIEPDMGRQPVINAINEANHSINLVMYGFTDDQLLNALIRQKLNGKTIKIILERSPYKAEAENSKTIAALNKNAVMWQGQIPPYRLIHQKTLIVDNSKALVMTFNFTHASFKNERNFALLIDDPSKVKEIAAVFSADWNHLSSINHNPDLLFSPDDSRSKLLSLIANAKNTIQIYAQNLNDYKVVGALAKAAKKGVNIQILTSTKMREKQIAYLMRAGVNIHYSKNLMIHAKILLVDHEKALVGSINLTRASLDDNRELSVISRDTEVIRGLEDTFRKDWQNGGTAMNDMLKKLMPDKREINKALHFLQKYVKENL